MNRKEASRRMAGNDLFFALVLVVIGAFARDEHPVGGWIMMILGGLWFALRFYHLFFAVWDDREEE